MARRQKPKTQTYENVDLFGSTPAKSPENKTFFTAPVFRLICVICAAAFEASNQRANVCSSDCRRERRLRYGATYRQATRDLKARLYAHFGGQKPTAEQILNFLQNRKGPKQ